MKTQNLAAVAMTAVLAIAAVLLVAWQSRELLHDEPRVSPPAAADTNMTDGVESGDTRPAALAAVNDAQDSIIKTDSGLNVTDCKWGSELVYDEDSGKDVWRCSLSSYWNYTTATLETMAYADAEAARVLAHRVREDDYGRAIQLALRSTALSGNSYPLIEARNWRATAHQNGDVDLSGIGQAYVLMAVADRVNEPENSRSERYEEIIRQSATDPDAAMQQLNEVVERMMDTIRQVELDVTGQVTIGEDDDA